MGHVTASKELAAPADRVWAQIADTGCWENWLTIHAGWLEEPAAELAEGARLVEKVVMLGMANKLEWTVEELQPGTSVTITGKGMAGVRSKFAFVLAPTAAGTTVTIDAEFSGSLIVGALGKAVEKDAVKNLEDSLEKLAAAASA
jgi:carbon monoxide dehydrogenase subunit G